MGAGFRLSRGRAQTASERVIWARRPKLPSFRGNGTVCRAGWIHLEVEAGQVMDQERSNHGSIFWPCDVPLGGGMEAHA